MSGIPKVLKDDYLYIIAGKIGTKTMSLGLQLGFKQTELQDFKHQNKKLVEENAAMLTEWVSRYDEKQDILESFLAAFRAPSVGLNKVAKEILEAHHQQQQSQRGTQSSAQPGPTQDIPKCLEGISLDKFASKLGNSGLKLGRALKIHDGQLEAFQAESKNDKVEENRKILAFHIKDNAGTDLVRNIAKALREINRSDIALELEKLAKNDDEFS